MALWGFHYRIMAHRDFCSARGRARVCARLRRGRRRRRHGSGCLCSQQRPRQVALTYRGAVTSSCELLRYLPSAFGDGLLSSPIGNGHVATRESAKSSGALTRQFALRTVAAPWARAWDLASSDRAFPYAAAANRSDAGTSSHARATAAMASSRHRCTGFDSIFLRAPSIHASQFFDGASWTSPANAGNAAQTRKTTSHISTVLA